METNTCKLVVIHAGTYAKNEYFLETTSKAPRLMRNGTYSPEIENPLKFGLGCTEIPFNIVITKDGKTHRFKTKPSSFGDFPEAYHIILEGSPEYFDRFNNLFTLNQRNALMGILKTYVANGFEITGAYEHDSTTKSPGFLIPELMLEPLQK